MKKALYISLTMILGICIALIAQAAFEFWYMKRLNDAFILTQPGSIWGIGVNFLPKWMQIAFPVVGAMVGLAIGIKWWKSVYKNESEANLQEQQ